MTDKQFGTCTRCLRERRIKFLKNKKNRRGKTVLRCRAQSVCHSIAKRKNPVYLQSIKAAARSGATR